MDYSTLSMYVDNCINRYCENLQCDSRLKDGMCYCLSSGKRLRPMLTLSILERLDPTQFDDLVDLCLVPEFVHTASLIIDDLPSFDNATERRGQKCTHLKYGEGFTYLLSMNLIIEAISIINSKVNVLKSRFDNAELFEKYQTQLTSLVTTMGMFGAIEGQLLSTFHTNGSINVSEMDVNNVPKLSKKEICNILIKKTSSFFELTLTIGWIFGGGELTKLDDVRSVARYLGLCYQINDDFEDYEEDLKHFSHNYVYHRGRAKAERDFSKYYRRCLRRAQRLNIDTWYLRTLLKSLDNKIFFKY